MGYESQNSSNDGLPSPQGSTASRAFPTATGRGSRVTPSTATSSAATVDWSAKWRGLSLLTATYFQQVNANPGNTSSTSTTVITTGPCGAGDSSFFQNAYYGQIGYFVIPYRLELIGRAGMLFTEGYPNIGEVYTLGANYYVYGQNLKIQSDVTFTPESAFHRPGHRASAEHARCDFPPAIAGEILSLRAARVKKTPPQGEAQNGSF